MALRKIVLAMIGVFGSAMGPMQVQLTLMLVFLVVVLTATVRPFSNEAQQESLLQGLEMASLLAIFLTLWAAMTFAAYPKCEDPSDGSQTLGWCDALSVSVGVVDFLILVSLVGCFVAVKMFGVRFGAKLAQSKVSKNLARIASGRGFKKRHHGPNIRANEAPAASTATPTSAAFSPSSSLKRDDGDDDGDDVEQHIEMTALSADAQSERKVVQKEEWQRHQDPSTGKYYSYNVATKETKWEEEVATTNTSVNPLVAAEEKDSNEDWQYVIFVFVGTLTSPTP